MRAIIVDDEEKSRSVLNNYLLKYCPHVDVVGSAGNIKEAETVIRAKNPDLLFLDIEMPGGNGFELLQNLKTVDFSVIFTTAYNDYAVQAIRISAVDYLLKPIRIEELQAAVKRAESKSSGSENESIKEFISNYSQPNSPSNKMGLPTQEGLEFVEIQAIIRCEANGKYTACYFTDGSRIIATKNLKEFEELLVDHHFYRVHHSHLVNVNHIKNYLKGEGGHLVMVNEDLITVSKRKKEGFLAKMKTI